MPPTLSGEKLRAAREAAGYTRQSAATKVERSTTALQQLERDRIERPDGNLLAALAKLYGVSVDSLFIHDPEDGGTPLATARPPLAESVG